MFEILQLSTSFSQLGPGLHDRMKPNVLRELTSLLCFWNGTNCDLLWVLTE